MDRIKRVSLFFRVIFQVLIVVMPIVFVVSWLIHQGSMSIGGVTASFIPSQYTVTGAEGGVLAHPLNALEIFMGMAVSAIPLFIELYIVAMLVRLFRLYEKGEIFSINNVHCIRNMGYGLLLYQFVNPVCEALMGFILTWRNLPGHRFASISLDQTNVGILFIAFFMILISWVMAEGCRLHEDQQLTI